METLELLDQKFDLSKTKSFVLKGYGIFLAKSMKRRMIPSNTGRLTEQSSYPWKVVQPAVRVLLVIAIELVISSCRRILISIINVLLMLLDGFRYRWRIPKTVTIMNGNTNRQGYGTEKLIKPVLKMRWSITEIQSLIVHLKHNMQNGTNIQLCSSDHFRNKLFSY